MRSLLCSQLQHLQQIKSQPLAFVLDLQCSALPSQTSTVISSPQNAAFWPQPTLSHKRAQDRTSKML